MKEIANIVKSFKEAEQSHLPAVLATVIGVEGSHYRRPGARMLATPLAVPVGSVSGGCLESDVLEHASEVIRTSRARVIHYDTTTELDLVFGSGTGCGGTVDILLEPAMAPGVRRLMEYFEAYVNHRRPLAVGTVFSVSGDAAACIGDRVILAGNQAEIIGIDDPSVRADIHSALRQVLDSQKGGVGVFATSAATIGMFLEYLRPPIALVIFGAGDDAIPVCRMASELGWQVTVADHRPDRATQERFPNAKTVRTYGADVLSHTMPLTDFDAAAVMTHSYERDLKLLSLLLRSNLKYIGLLGAAKRAEQILSELMRRDSHINTSLTARLCAPIGLDINAEGADEIALAIIAEIQMVLSGGTGQSLSLRRRQVHLQETGHRGGKE